MSIGSFFRAIFGGGGGGASREAERVATQQADLTCADKDAKELKLRTGMSNIDSAFSGFNDDYFAKLQRDYTDYAMPQLQDQYDVAKKNIMFALARKGNLGSSVAGDQFGLLDKENARNITTIEGTGLDYANQARSAVEANRHDITGQLNTTFDADAAGSSAMSAAKALAVPKAFSPLTQLFTNISAIAAQNRLASSGDTPELPRATTGARNYSQGGSNNYVVGG